MKKLLFFLAILLLGCTAKETTQSAECYRSVSLQSEILGEERQLLISVPRVEQSDKFGAKKYPVIYVLDGEDMFEYVAGMVNFLSTAKGNDVLPPSIVVGIVNTNRNRDLTHDPIEYEPGSGAGEPFSRFVEEEVFTFIESEFSVVQHRTLIGHSYGGLFAINTLNRQPELFDNYIALDPSYRYLRNKDTDYRSDHYKNKQLFVGIANTLIQHNEDPAKYASSNQHYYELVRFCEQLDTHPNARLSFACQYYENDDHASLCVDATYDALRQIFAWYHLDIAKIRNQHLSPEDLYSRINDYTQTLSTLYKEPTYPDELLMQKLAFSVDDPALTNELLRQNVLHYPTSFNAHFALGVFYQRQGKADSAAIYLQKAVDLQQDERALELLQKMKE